jgi:hypothetical protein
MRLSLKQQIQAAMKTYESMVITESSKLFPSQVLLCVNYITWTTKIDIALKSNGDHKKELEKIKTENDTYLADLSKLVLQETDKKQCQNFANLILSQGYYDIILDDLVILPLQMI